MGIYSDILEKNPLIRKAEILIVDDSAISTKIVENFLNDIGIKNIYFAKNGKEAIEILSETVPSLIITDLYMPEINGFELIEKIKSQPHLDSIPIIMQTSATSSEEINKAYVAGASDVILKPIQKEEFNTKAILHIESSVFKKRIHYELENAIELQKSIMPNEEKIASIKELYGLDLSVLFSPSSEIGGDFWGFEQLSYSELAIYNVDISGHGVASAMNAIRIHGLMEEKISIVPDPALYMTKLNKKVSDLLPIGQYATMFFGVINIEENYLEYVNAASPFPIIVRDNSKAEILENTELPIGVNRNVLYKNRRVKFNKGDSLILYSDALNESTNEQGEFFDIQKISKTLQKHHKENSAGMLKKLVKKFESFSGEYRSDDDLTINIYKRV